MDHKSCSKVVYNNAYDFFLSIEYTRSSSYISNHKLGNQTNTNDTLTYNTMRSLFREWHKYMFWPSSKRISDGGGAMRSVHHLDELDSATNDDTFSSHQRWTWLPRFRRVHHHKHQYHLTWLNCIDKVCPSSITQANLNVNITLIWFQLKCCSSHHNKFTKQQHLYSKLCMWMCVCVRVFVE